MNVPKNELTGDEWIKVIEDLSKNGVFFVNISGGEPTMHKNFKDIIKSLVKNEIYFMLTTNALFNDDIKDVIISAKDYILLCDCSIIQNYELPLNYKSLLDKLKKGINIDDKIITDDDRDLIDDFESLGLLDDYPNSNAGFYENGWISLGYEENEFFK